MAVRCVSLRKRLPRVSWWWRGRTVFISYRRSGSAFAAAWLHQQLEARLGAGRVIRDVESIPAGTSFPEFIRGVIPGCRAVILFIDPEWTVSEASAESRYGEGLGDMVALELSLALEQGIKVIPVLVRGARMPTQDDLPPRLRQLSLLQAVELRADRTSRESVDQIIEALWA